METLKLAELVLLQDINFFGRQIVAGTVYKQVNADYYHPTVNGAQCPSLALDFYTVKNNPSYFLQLVKYRLILVITFRSYTSGFAIKNLINNYNEKFSTKLSSCRGKTCG